MTACDREELIECLADQYMFAYVEVEFVKFSKQGRSDLPFLISASSSRSRGAQTAP